MAKLARDESIQETNRLLRLLVRENLNITYYKQIQRIVRERKAKDIFNPGDQISVPWKDSSGKIYDMPFDIVHFGDVQLMDGSVVPGMYLQSHYAIPFGVQFSQNEAFWYCNEELAAGTYNVTMGNSWGNNVVSGKTYMFTLTQNVPVGGQLQFGLINSEIGALPDQDPSNWRVRVYTDNTTVTPTEIVTVEEGTDGTSLGVLSSSTKFASSGLNNMQRASYGYNRWSFSAVRQFLNSDKPKNQWWTPPASVYTRPPIQLSTVDGFMRGFEKEFLDILRPVKVTTALNTVSDSIFGDREDTYDTFFLASKRNQNLNEQLNGVEGDIFDYWLEATNGVKPADYTDGAAPITYALENHNSPQHVRLRSAIRGTAYYTWYVYSSGGVSNRYATTSHRFAPVCVIS